jgi:hypothetical protein
MSFRRAINLFPWDVQAEGAGPCLEAIAGLGCSAVVLSPNYHRARPSAPGRSATTIGRSTGATSRRIPRSTRNRRCCRP